MEKRFFATGIFEGLCVVTFQTDRVRELVYTLDCMCSLYILREERSK